MFYIHKFKYFSSFAQRNYWHIGYWQKIQYRASLIPPEKPKKYLYYGFYSKYLKVVGMQTFLGHRRLFQY